MTGFLVSSIFTLVAFTSSCPYSNRHRLRRRNFARTLHIPTGGSVAHAHRESNPNELVSHQAGFLLHAGVACKSNQRKKLERLCRYVTRPAIAEQRLSRASNSDVILALKTPYDDGTSHVVLSLMEFIGRLAALVPRPRVNLTRFHGGSRPTASYATTWCRPNPCTTHQADRHRPTP